MKTQSSKNFINILCEKLHNIAKDSKKDTYFHYVCIPVSFCGVFPFLPYWCKSLIKTLFETQSNNVSHEGIGKSVGEVCLVHI